MTGPVRSLRRCWPQKVRTRLALLYACLCFAAGCALLSLTYGLVAASLPAGSAAAAGKTSPQQNQLNVGCKNEQTKAPGTPLSLLPACRQAKAFHAGASAGSASQRQRALNSLLLFSLVGLGVTTAASGGLGWLVAGRVLRPVRTITETARRASQQHLGERLALAGPRDELRELADTFDDMLERLDRAFAAERRFVANASHELRTPLTLMRTAIDVTLAKPGRTPGQLEEMAVRVRRSIDRAEDMMSALLTLAVSDQGPASSEFTDLATMTEDAVDAVAADITRLGLRVDTQLEPAETAGDPQLLERMVWNLVGNAVRHNEPGGWIRLRTGTGDPGAYLQIANSGPVVPDEAVSSLFEPFRRLAGRAGPGDGAGLGLSIARSVATAHGATVSARSQPGGGLDISVVLPGPVTDPRPAPAAP
jgi:signal transduction histidine kinase